MRSIITLAALTVVLIANTAVSKKTAKTATPVHTTPSQNDQDGVYWTNQVRQNPTVILPDLK